MLTTIVRAVGRSAPRSSMPKKIERTMAAKRTETSTTRHSRNGDSRGAPGGRGGRVITPGRSEEHTSELQSLMRRPYAVFCLKKKNKTPQSQQPSPQHISQDSLDRPTENY